MSWPAFDAAATWVVPEAGVAEDGEAVVDPTPAAGAD